MAWVGPDDPGGPYFEETTPDQVLAAAQAMGAPFVNVLLTGRRANVTVDGAAEVLAGVCDRAAEHGLGITVEFATRSAVNDIATACAVIERCGRANVGICMDTWAFHFGTCGLDALAEAVPRILTLQLDDAPAERPEDFGHATRYHRLVPGDGAIDYPGIFGALAAGNSTAPVILEVFNDELSWPATASKASPAISPMPPAPCSRRRAERSHTADRGQLSCTRDGGDSDCDDNASPHTRRASGCAAGRAGSTRLRSTPPWRFSGCRSRRSACWSTRSTCPA